MTDTTNKPINDSKEELTEAELDQVAGGLSSFGAVAEFVETPTQPAAPGKIKGFASSSGSLPV
jgi:hypothetical protein